MNRFLIIVSLILANAMVAQNLELGKVSKAELEQHRHPIDTSAPAAILFKKGTTTFKYKGEEGFVSYTEISVRIKIYKKEGLDWANFKVPYYVGYSQLDDEAIEFSKAQTYNLENGKIVKTKVTNENIFKERINEYWNSKSIAFPNVKVGSVLEFRYILKSQNIAVLPEFQFQYKIPVNVASYVTEIPEFYMYQGILTGYVKVANDAKLESTSQPYLNKYKQTEHLGFSQIVTTYSVADVPALIEEKYVDNINNYYGKLDHELQVVRMPNEKPQHISTTWESVAKSIYNDADFGKELEKYQYFANDLPKVVVDKKNDTEKVDAVLNYVKERMTWNDRLGYHTEKGVEKAYAERSGNTAEMNLMLVSMLRMAGLQANPVLISTRDNGKAPFPSRARLNSVIAAVTINDKLHLLDATYKNAALDVLPLRNLNDTGRMIQKGGIISEVNLMPTVHSTEVISMIANINAEGKVSGQFRQQYTNYKAAIFRDSYIGVNEDHFIEKQEQRTGMAIDNYKVENDLALAKPLTVTYNFASDNMVESIGGKMYISPLLFLTMDENPFKQEKRDYPIDFIFPFQEKYNISLTIPDGYEIESMPAAINLAMEKNLGNFKYNIEKQGNKIQLSATFDVNQPVIPAQSYEMLKSFFKAMIAKQGEKIILKKV